MADHEGVRDFNGASRDTQRHKLGAKDIHDDDARPCITHFRAFIERASFVNSDLVDLLSTAGMNDLRCNAEARAVGCGRSCTTLHTEHHLQRGKAKLRVVLIQALKPQRATS